jgi:hypothetical protein
MTMRIFLSLALVAVGLAPAAAGDLQEVLRLWALQTGQWEGRIDIYGPDSATPQTIGLSTRWDAVPDHTTVTKIETFRAADRESSAVTLMFADPDAGVIVTPYFINGQQRDYHFSVQSVSVVDDTHWTITIATPQEQEIYEGRPAVLRYVRKRDGDVIENTKEVKFLDQQSSGDYELRSRIRQARVSSPSGLQPSARSTGQLQQKQ